MAIYRGAGGAGDATGDSASEALIVRELAAEVALDAAAAEAAKVAAIAAKVAAETAETNAETAETNAETAQAAAASSASAAATSATNASNSATAAQTAETNAETAETNAASSASAASTSATNAASSASSASTSATNASNSATAAASSASAASTSATNASNSATAAASSASAASTSATNAASSATAAAGSATSAASSATTATTQASNAATSATAAQTAETNAETAETNAAASASAASTSASNAATSATNASNSASAASTSATNAANSASAASATYDSFDDRYLGVKSSPPVVDNDGNTLLVGALYFDSSANQMFVYNGSSWVSIGATVNGTAERFRYISTAGQTIFSGSDSNGNVLNYEVGFIDVYLNGVRLDQTDYTATSGNTFVLTSAAALNDELNIVAYGSFSLANVYTQAASDGRFRNLTVDIPVADIAATGTPSSSTFLRGDGAWETVTQTRLSGGSTGLTPNTLTGGDVTLGGTLAVSNGGTGLTSVGASGNVLTSNGSNWVSSTPTIADGSITDPKIANGLTSGTNYISYGIAESNIVPPDTSYFLWGSAYILRGGTFNFKVTVFNGNIGNENNSTIFARIYRNGVAVSSAGSVFLSTNAQGTITIGSISLESDGVVQLYIANDQGGSNSVGVRLWSYGVSGAVKLLPFSSATRVV